MSLVEVAKRFQEQISQALVGKPSREQLVAERDSLLAAQPQPPASGMIQAGPLTCTCPHCTAQGHEEQAARVAFAVWEAHVRRVETGLFKLGWGDETERDEPGEALAELCSDLLRAGDKSRAEPWERRIIRDALGRETGAWETAPAIAERTAALGQLYRRAKDTLFLLPGDQLTAAIAEIRQRMIALLSAPLKRPLELGVARRAGLEPGPASEPLSPGLVPAAGPDKSVLSGTIRFKRGR